MKLIRISFLFSFFILLNLTSNEKSSSSRDWYEKKRIAFIVGNNQYQNTTNLKYAVKDSREMKDLFLEVGYFDKIYLLNDKEKNLILVLKPKLVLIKKENLNQTKMELLKNFLGLMNQV